MTKSQGNILIVDDDVSIRRVVSSTFSVFGFQFEEASTGEEALAKIRAKQFDAVLLDLNMPGMGGLETCRQIRHITPVLPVLMLTVKDNQEDIIRALDSGADDYVMKPFRVGELSARLRAAVRRYRALDRNRDEFSFGDLHLDRVRRTLKKRDHYIHLTPKEFDLMHYFMANAGVPIRHSVLLRAVWGSEYGGELEYLRTFIRQLRTKIEDDPSHPVCILTEHYLGYRFSDGCGPEEQPRNASHGVHPVDQNKPEHRGTV